MPGRFPVQLPRENARTPRYSSRGFPQSGSVTRGMVGVERGAVPGGRDVDGTRPGDWAGGVLGVTVVGWDRDGWRRLTGIRDLGEGLPAFRPG